MKILFAAIGAHQADKINIDPALMMMSAVAQRDGHETALEIFADYRPGEADLERIRAHKPDLLAFGIYSIAWYEYAAFIRAIRERLDVPVICGGYQATCAPEDTIAAQGIDFICVGEGDESFAHLLARLAAQEDPGGIPGIWVKKKGALKTIQKNGFAPLVYELDKLPLWDRQLYPTPYMGAYHIQKFGNCVPISTGRGCPYKCTFCSNPVLRDLADDKRKFLRKRSIENLVTEAARLAELYDPDSFFIVDEQFATYKWWLDEFCEGWKKHVKRKFVILSTTDSLPRPLLEQMADAGLFLIGMGVENGDDHYRSQTLGKPIKNTNIIEAFDTCRDLGIKTFAAVMIGLPHETSESIQRTCDLIERCDPDLLLPCVYNPLPGTHLRQLCDAEGLLENVRWKDVADGFGHQYSNKERQLMRVGEDEYLRVRKTHITGEDYRAGSDRVDHITLRIESRFFATQEEPILRERIAKAAQRPPAERRGFAVLRHEAAPSPPRELHRAFGRELDEMITSSPWPVTRTPYRYAPALGALARAPLGVVVDAAGEDALTLARDAVSAGAAVMAPAATCAALGDVAVPVAVDAPLLYEAGLLKLFVYLQNNFLGPVRDASLHGAAAGPEAMLQAVLLLTRIAAQPLAVETAARDGVWSAAGLIAPDGIRTRLDWCGAEPAGGARWRLTVHAEAGAYHWSKGRHHQTVCIERGGKVQRVRLDIRHPEVAMAEAFAAFARREADPLAGPREAAWALAARDALAAACSGRKYAVGTLRDALDPLLYAPKLSPEEILDLVAGRPGAILAAPDLEGSGGHLFMTRPPHLDNSVSDAALFAVLENWCQSGETLFGAVMAAAADPEAMLPRAAGWMSAWARQAALARA